MAVNNKIFTPCPPNLTAEDLNKFKLEINNAIEDNGLALNEGDQTQLGQVIGSAGSRYGVNVAWAETMDTTPTARVIQLREAPLTAPITLKDGTRLTYIPLDSIGSPGASTPGALTLQVGVNAPLPIIRLDSLNVPGSAPQTSYQRRKIVKHTFNFLWLSHGDTVTVEYDGGSLAGYPAFVLIDSTPFYDPSNPVGTIKEGAFASVNGNAGDPGWLPCWGISLDIADWPVLYEKIGSAFDGGSPAPVPPGSFAIPNMLGRQSIMADNNTRIVGTYYGANAITLNENQNAAHLHKLDKTTVDGNYRNANPGYGESNPAVTFNQNYPGIFTLSSGLGAEISVLNAVIGTNKFIKI